MADNKISESLGLLLKFIPELEYDVSSENKENLNIFVGIKNARVGISKKIPKDFESRLSKKEMGIYLCDILMSDLAVYIERQIELLSQLKICKYALEQKNG